MWKWECMAKPGIIWEHHSWTLLNESLTAHEKGAIIPGLFEAPPCNAMHEYWDDGKPCDQERFTGKKCKIPYIRDDCPPEDLQ